MKPHHAEQLDAILKLSVQVFNKYQEVGQTDALITSYRDNKSPPLDKQDIQTTIVMAEKKDTDLLLEEDRPKAR